MREIGGYIELDTYHLPMLHEDAVALNCGRNALAYLIRARKIKKLWIPKFICDSVTRICEREGVPYSFYSIGYDFLPTQEIELKDGEWFYFVNYYSQLGNETILEYVKKYRRIIVDQAQSYFQESLSGVDTIYTCRKYFGVADGAFLYTDAVLNEVLPLDISYGRMRFLLGRFEKTASEFYNEYVSNNELFTIEPIKQMSKLTRNLLHGLDYKQIQTVREANYRYLHKVFNKINGLKLNERPGTFMYPLLLENGAAIRRKLQEKKIYIPILWPDVFGWCQENEPEYIMSHNILPLPIDQRYNTCDLKYMVEDILKNINC